MTKQNNKNGNNYYAKRNIHITYETKKDEPKKHLTRLPRAIETFVGREDELTEIKESFEATNTLVLVNGVGGIGKSAIARQFLNTQLDKYDYKIWINYKDSLTSSIISDLNTLFKVKGNEEEVYSKIVYELNNLNGNNLMIIDNFDNPSIEDKAEVKEFLPNFKILITSRSIIEDIKEINVDKLSEDEAIELFQKHYKSEFDKEELKELLKQIGYHSLLIELIAKAMQKSQLNTLNSIRENFQKRNLEAINIKIDFRKKSDLIIEHIKALFSLDNLTNSQILLLKKFSILPSVEIEFKNLVEIFKIKKNKLSEFDSDLSELVSKGWINKNNHSFKIHPLIIEFINIDNKITYEEAKDIIEYYIDKIAEVYKINPIDGFKYISYAKNILEIIIKENEKIATLANNLSLIYQALGDFENALEFKFKSLQIEEKVLDKNHPQLASSYNNLSMIYKDLGELQNALNYAKKALEIREKILDKNHPDLATSYNNLSLIYRRLKDLNNALSFAKKTNEIFEKIFDKNHPSLAISYDNISLIYQDLGELQNALSYSIKANKIFEKILDENHPSLATSYNNIAGIYFYLKKYETAKEYMIKAINILKTIFPNGHPHLDIAKESLKIIEGYLS